MLFNLNFLLKRRAWFCLLCTVNLPLYANLIPVPSMPESSTVSTTGVGATNLTTKTPVSDFATGKNVTAVSTETVKSPLRKPFGPSAALTVKVTRFINHASLFTSSFFPSTETGFIEPSLNRSNVLSSASSHSGNDDKSTTNIAPTLSLGENTLSTWSSGSFSSNYSTTANNLTAINHDVAEAKSGYGIARVLTMGIILPLGFILLMVLLYCLYERKLRRYRYVPDISKEEDYGSEMIDLKTYWKPDDSALAEGRKRVRSDAEKRQLNPSAAPMATEEDTHESTRVKFQL